MYSRNVSKKVLKLQEKQREEIAKATKEKEAARTHEERLKIESKTRSNLDKMVSDHHKPVKKAVKAAGSQEVMIDLKNEKAVKKAVKAALKAK